MQVINAKEDARFATNPLVTGKTNITFYTGAPLVDENGYALGSLCVIYEAAKKLSEEQIASLRIIASQVVNKLKLRRQQQELLNANNKVKELNEQLNTMNHRLTKVLDTIAEGVGITNEEGKLIYINPTAKVILDVDKTEVTERTYYDELWYNERLDGSPLPKEEHPVSIAFLTGKTVQNYEFAFQKPGKEKTFLTMNAAPLIDDSGKITGAVGTFTNITERLELNEKLRKSEEVLRLACDAAKIGTWHIDPVTKKLNYNTALAKIFGYEQIAPMTYDDAIAQVTPAYRDKILKEIETAILSNSEYNIIYTQNRFNDNALVWLHSSGRITQDSNGQYSVFSGVVRNITDQVASARKMEELNASLAATNDKLEATLEKQISARNKMEESELFSQNIFHNSPVANIVFTGNDMVIKAVNENMLSMLGRDSSILDKTFMEAMPELKDTPLMDRLREVLKTGITYMQPEEKITLIKEGNPYIGYYNYIYKALEDVNGERYGIMVTATDVTTNVNIRKTLERSEQQVRALIQSAPFPIGVYEGRELCIVLANQTMLDTWGKGDNVIGKLYPEILPELKGTPIVKQLIEVLTTGIPFHAKNIRIGLIIQGVLEIHYFNYSFTPVFDENGKVYAVMNTSADVTDLNVAKQKIEENEQLLQSKVEERTASLETANANLVASNKELEEFTFAASHDMQEPLRKVETYTSILQANFLQGLDAKGKDYVQRIIFSVQRMRKLIDDLLEYSHQTREGQQFVKTDLNDIITQIEADLELDIVQKQATIKKEVLPFIEAIPAQMRQLFHNLFSNALKFSRKDIPLQINVICKVPGNDNINPDFKNVIDKGFVGILFSDNGIGFEQQYSFHIFSLFKRLHGKHEYGGTGIGLALCKKVVENHNGFIDAFSAPDEGASFLITLPVKQR